MIRTIEWKKSSLQEKLESEGWKFLGNYSVADEDIRKGWPGTTGLPGFGRDAFKPTRCELKSEFAELYMGVRIEAAYNSDAEPFPLMEMAAVYVKGERKQSD